MWSSPAPAPWPPPSDSPWSLPPGLAAAPAEASQVVRAARARRPSVVAALLSLEEVPRPTLPRSASAPAHQQLAVDAAAFSRYYEGSVVGPADAPEDPVVPEPGAAPCGGPLASLALALPGRVEGLVKLLAHSLHLLLAAVCSRWACSRHSLGHDSYGRGRPASVRGGEGRSLCKGWVCGEQNILFRTPCCVLCVECLLGVPVHGD